MSEQTMNVGRVGYIGAGVMGSGIVKNLRKNGYPVSFVVHRSQERVAELQAAGAEVADDYASLAARCDVIMLTVPDSSVVEPLLLGADGIGPHLREGQIVVDMSTSYPTSTIKIGKELAGRGIVLMDAPLTGSRPQAEAGTLTLMCAGPRSVYDKLEPLFKSYAAKVFYVGQSGAGHTIKLINNYLGQASLAAICESTVFAQKLGVDLQSVFDVVSASGGNSAPFQRFLPRFMKRDFELSFAQKYVHKDIRYITTLAREYGVPMPLGTALMSIHDLALAKGYGEEDAGGLLKFMEEMTGVHVGPPDA